LLQVAVERRNTWIEELETFFERDGAQITDKGQLWSGAVSILLSELLDVHAVSSRLTFEQRSSACEKVRSVLLHLLWKSVFESGQDTATEVYADFDLKCQAVFAPMAEPTKAKRRRNTGSRSDADVLDRALKSFRFISFVDVNWIQGCEADVVVICAPSVDGRKFPEAPKTRKLHIWRSLSRAKLLSVAVIPARTEDEAKDYWPGPWHDWSQFKETSSDNENTPPM
jgi:hypothetical protein